jgi:DNA end-binding protein Ku
MSTLTLSDFVCSGQTWRMPRPIWNGTISFGLVAIPIKLYHAVSKKSVSFNQLDERTMSRIKLKKVSADTGEDVEDEHIVKGYEVTKGRYIVVDPDELEPFIPSATHSIELEEFVDLGEIDPVFFDTAYVVAPDKTPKPYKLLATAMEQANKVAIGRFVMRNKQYVAAIRAVDGRLMLSTMVFHEEVVDIGSIEELGTLESVEVSDREAKMAEALVESLAAAFEPSKYHDDYRQQVLALIDKKAAGEAFEAPTTSKPAPQVVDLMAALEASVKAAKDARGRHPSTNESEAAGEGAEATVTELASKPARAKARKSA